MSIDRVVTGLFAFAGGIVAGILLAPQSGAQTREQLSEEGRAQLKKMEGQLEGLEKRLAEVSRSLRNASHDVSEKVKHATVDQVLPEVPDSDEFKVEGKEVTSDLRHLPRK